MVLAANLLQAVADRGQEALVGGEDVTVEVELDDRRGAHQRLDQALVFARSLDGAGQVAGMQGEVANAPLAVLDRLQDRAQPGFLAIAAQQAKRAVQVLATSDGGFHPLVEIQRPHMSGDDVLDVASKQLVGPVEHLALEVVIDHLDPSLGVELQHQHLAVEAALDLFDTHQVFAQLPVFLLELVVEHHRSPGAQQVVECIFIGRRHGPLSGAPGNNLHAAQADGQLSPARHVTVTLTQSSRQKLLP